MMMHVRASVVFALLLVAQPSKGSTTVFEAFYEVSGSTATELVTALDGWRPDKKWATTAVRPINVDYEKVPAGDAFFIGKVSVDQEITVTFPVRSDIQSVPVCLKDQWHRMMVSLRAHEYRHVGSISGYEDRLNTMSASAGPQPSIPALNAVFESINAAVKSEILAEQAEIDATPDPDIALGECSN